tara:strand:- start:1586 stop:4060 length:2475 start_codon:yes stop_codon:yes gene_type:complete
MAKFKKNIYKLHFDLFSKYSSLCSMVNKLRKKRKHTILEVGANDPTLTKFLPNDTITFLNKENFDLDNFVHSTTKYFPFSDATFDFVVSLDTLEHMNPDERLDFLKELIRSSKYYVVLGFPFLTNKAQKFEDYACHFYKDLMGKNHSYLKEHAAFTLPDYKKIVSYLEEKRYNYALSDNMDLNDWLPLTLFSFLAENDPKHLFPFVKLCKQHNKQTVNHHLKDPYRKIIVIAKKQNFPLKISNTQKPFSPVNYFSERLLFILKTYGFKELLFRTVRKLKTLKANKNYLTWINTKEKNFENLDLNLLSYKPKISIVMPVYNPKLSYLKQAISSVINQSYDNWELCIVDDASTNKAIKHFLQSIVNNKINITFLAKNKGISFASNKALVMAQGEFIGFLDHDDVLAPNALYEVVKKLNDDRKLDIFYSDEDKLDFKGKRCNPFFKPDWSPDLLLSCMYLTHFRVYRKKIIEKIDGFRTAFDGSQDYDLALRATEITNKIAHIPKILYHWRMTEQSAAFNPTTKPYAYTAAQSSLRETLKRRDIQGEVIQTEPGYYRIKRKIIGKPKVSIIILSKNPVLIKKCIKNIKGKTSYKSLDIIICFNNMEKKIYESLKTTLESDNIKIIYCEGTFNFAKFNNFSANYAHTDYLLFLNDDIGIKNPNWIEPLLEQAQRKEVGAVGAKLLFLNKEIQHAGMIIGLFGTAGNAFSGLNQWTNKANNLANVIRNCSAVTGACLMIRKKLFLEIGGFDEHFPVSFNDVDLCLRLRKKDYLITYTPFSVLYHIESATRKHNDFVNMPYLQKKWGNTFKEDPYYNINLTKNKTDYSLP